ncbi:MAG TPA: dienelactone hydrolase family protein [Niabella sp.]|nr:dienelactone hydrolase family protein [Niabella sp.]HQW14094.1 dienelactone hydrolase family protein [Niabella sp.]HQX19363.1 dienelactone hydrolase family protein [Niabella sp.]HQX41779.1 dienelactone hydrolase family protein [Niabella sp.]HRB05580.1 dienelactone hydrolase family protein [Niabella sp.]
MKKIYLLLLILIVSFSSIMAQELKTVMYKDGHQKLNGLVTNNAGKNRPGVLILPAWMGIDEESKTAALELEKQGYIAFIADIYGEGNIPTDFSTASKIAGFYRQDFKAYQHRIELALDQLKKQGVAADKIAVIGYCFGGTGALETARAGLSVQGVVSIHGGLNKDASRPNGALKTKILIEHPAEDKSVTREHQDNLVKEMNEGKADWQIIIYAHCGHTFTNPKSKEYNELMAKRAWSHTLLFLNEILK